MGSQSSSPESPITEKTSPQQLGQANREAWQVPHDNNQNLGNNARIDTAAEVVNKPIEEMDGLPIYDDDDAAVAGADFGDLEMFDSNASQAPFSSQAPQQLKSDDPLVSAPTSSSKRDKKKKKKGSRDAELVAEEQTPSSKRKKSKKKSVQDAEIQDNRPTNGSSPMREANSAALEGTQLSSGIEDATSQLTTIPSSPTKKKRKLSDSAERKRRKKRRGSDVSDNVIQSTQEGISDVDLGVAQGMTFLHLNADGGGEPLNTVHEEEIPDPNSQLLPIADHRSQSLEARSRENSVPFRAQFAPMAIEGPPPDADEEQLRAGVLQAEGSKGGSKKKASHESDKGEHDVESLAREAWQEHLSTQNDSERAEPSDEVQADESKTNEGADAPHEDGEPSIESPKRRRSTRTKKAKPTFFEQPTPIETPVKANRRALEELPSPSANTPKRKARAKRPTKKAKEPPQPVGSEPDDADEDEAPVRPSQLNGYTQGRFTDAELARLSHAVERYRVDYELTQFEVNELIQAPGGTSAGDAHAQLWLRLVAECPDRKRQKVINIARKKFHNFVARGTWTSEQDAELSALIDVHGTAWSKIAAIINRHPEDVRDRYRNYVVCGTNQRKDIWDGEEEARLTTYVKEAMEVIDELRNTSPKNQLLKKAYEELIDWQNISEKMGRTRSRLQCITKWKAMQDRESGKKKKKSKKPRLSKEKAESPPQAPVTISNEEISSQLDTVRQQLASMHEEDQYRLILAIQGASALTEAQIPWTKLLDKKFRSRWNHGTLVLLWDRLKQTVPDFESKSVLDNAQHIINEYNRTGGLPEVSGSGYDDDERETDLLRQIQSREQKPSGTLPKSAEFVEDSGVEDNAENQEADKPISEEMSIDPALTQEAPPSAQKPATSKKATPRRASTTKKKSKKQSVASQDPIEDAEVISSLPVVNEGEESNIDEDEFRKKKTPSKFKAANSTIADPPMPQAESYSDSDMEDMEDLPARVSA